VDPFTIFAIFSALATTVSTFSQMEGQRRQAEYQAAVGRQNAIAKRQQADLVAKKTVIEQRAKDIEKRNLTQEYKHATGLNRSMLLSGNVDITSGSPLSFLEGNYNRFADDLGELEYQKELIGWQGQRESQILNWEGDVADNNASYLQKTAGSIGTSLLTAGLMGGASGLGAYMMPGPKVDTFDPFNLIKF